MGRDNRRSGYGQPEKKLRRLNWNESQEHYQALKEIEDRNTVAEDVDTILSNSQRKRFEANRHNETRKYLQDNGLEYVLGGFYIDENI